MFQRIKQVKKQNSILKIIKVFIIINLISLLFATKVKAANNYGCAWVGVGPICILGVCSPPIGNCVVGYQNCNATSSVPNPNVCSGKSYAFCIAGGVFSCLDTEPNSCASQGGSPNLGKCPAGSTQITATDVTSPFICCVVPDLQTNYTCANDCKAYGCSKSGFNIPNPNICNALDPGSCKKVGAIGLKFSCISDFVLNGVQFKSGPQLENCGIKTALGCMPIENEQNLALFFLGWGMGLGGGIALILIVLSTISIMTSAGDPRKLQAGKEMLNSAIAGLLLLVLSAFILNFIGVDLLGILS
jgi:hypothetical protein